MIRKSKNFVQANHSSAEINECKSYVRKYIHMRYANFLFCHILAGASLCSAPTHEMKSYMPIPHGSLVLLGSLSAPGLVKSIS